MGRPASRQMPSSFTPCWPSAACSPNDLWPPASTPPLASPARSSVCEAEMTLKEGRDQPLVCVECGRRSASDAKGWRAYLNDEHEAVTFCPSCAEREFSEDGPAGG